MRVGHASCHDAMIIPYRGAVAVRTPLILVAAAIATCCAGGGMLAIANALSHHSNGTSTLSSGSTIDTGAAAPPVPGLETQVRDGKFEFVVHSMECGQSRVGNQFIHADAKGQYCVVTVTVRNIGTESQRFADGFQQAIGPDGTRYSADTGAGVIANGSGDAVWNVVNPGIELTVRIVYDIPTTATIAQLRLHDSGLSGGATVAVAG
jgi:hypothetical protein